MYIALSKFSCLFVHSFSVLFQDTFSNCPKTVALLSRDPILASLLLTLYILTEQSHPCLCLQLPTKSLYFHFRLCCNHCLNEWQHHLSQYKTQIYGSHLRFIYLPISLHPTNLHVLNCSSETYFTYVLSSHSLVPSS